MKNYLKIDQDDVMWAKLIELDIFNPKKKIGLKNATPAQILQKILLDSWTLQEEEKDMIVMQHLFGYEINGKKYQIELKAAQMLVEFLGTDLSKISNELDKLMLILPKETIIDDKHIEDNIGISKDFNNFELRKAVGEKNIVKSNRIINYFAENPKDNPMVVTVALLFSFFTQLLQFHGLSDKAPRHVASALKINPYFVNDYIVAGRNFPMKKVSAVISVLREFDVKSKGVESNAVTQGDLLKEMLYKILN